MKDKPEIKESGAAGKPGESTAAGKMTLTASGIESLLSSEFGSEEKPKADPSQEIPEGKPADGEATPETEPVAENVETKDGEESPKAEDGEADPEETKLPADVQTALEDWEQTGGPLPKPLQALVDKRIGKLTGARDTEKARADKAEAELARVQAEAESLRADPNRPGHAAPAPVMDEKALNGLATTANKFMAEVESYLDNSATEEERTRVERFMASERLDTNGLKRRVRETNAWLTQELPQQRDQLRAFKSQEAAAEPVVKSHFPWLDDKASPEYAKAQSVLGIMPELKQRTPAHRVAAGTYVLGLEVMDHLAKAGVKTDAAAAVREALAKAFPVTGTAQPSKAKTPPPKAPAGNGAAVPPVKAKAAKDEAARQSFNKAPTRQNATELARAALMEG